MFLWTKRNLIAAISVFLCVLGIFYLLYLGVFFNFIQEVRRHAMYVAIFASAYIDPEDVERVRGPGDVESRPFKRIQGRLQRIKEKVPDISFVYVMRRSTRPGARPTDFEYVVDLPSEDKNQNGVIDPSERMELPGNPYDASSCPAMVRGWDAPDADDATTPDPPYSDCLSGYAPIKDSGGRTVGLLGVDVAAPVIQGKLLTVDVLMLSYALLLAFLVSAVVFLLLGRSQALAEIRRMNAELEDQNLRLEGALKLRNELSHMIVHDLRGPVFVVNGLAELVLSTAGGRLSAEDRGHLEKIRLQARRILGLLGDMLMVAKEESGALVLNRRSERLSSIIASVVENNRIAFQINGVEIATEFPPDEAPLPLDCELMARVFDNLVLNALKYSPRGSSVLLRVAQPAPPPGERLKTIATVSDQGPGVPDDMKERIFEKFATTAAAPVRGKQVGLGLSFVKLVVDAHGGRVRVADNVPCGATFVVELFS